ncbi:hypothetical protein [Streptomyces sp. NPDC017940]|uniref:hypothetical protein n=1 Tax=Streptomyces sp. NPDC017940 TaxID=3365017 RepID=UPI0037AD67F4
MRRNATRPRTGARPRRFGQIHRRLAVVVMAAAALVLGPQSALAHAAGGDVKVDTGGVEELLTDNLIPIGILVGGLFIVFGARKRDLPAAATQAGIVLLGIGVVGLASISTGLGESLVGMVTSGG